MITTLFQLEELEASGMTKRHLADKILLTKWEAEGRCAFDYALPQQWLDEFVEKTGLDYGLVLSTTFWVYSKDSVFGYPVSGCSEVNNKLKEWRYANV